MNKPRICAVIVHETPAGIEAVTGLVDFFELRLDLIGAGWRQLVPRLQKPWLACNRRAEEGGGWRGGEAARIEELLRAAALGAAMVDVELGTEKLAGAVKLIRARTRCLISHHDFTATPPLETLREIVRRQRESGADIGKLVTTARDFTDNLTVLRLVSEAPRDSLVAFAMGPLGITSRVLSPLCGGYFTYAALAAGAESAPGQVTAAELRGIYRTLGGNAK